MAVRAAGYVLNVPEHRRALLLPDAKPVDDDRQNDAVAEPVDRFDHSRRAPLIVLAAFQDRKLTHLASGRRGASAGTGLDRLNMSAWHTLKEPLAFDALLAAVPARYRVHLKRRLDRGGLLPPKTLGVVVDTLMVLMPDLAPRLLRYSEARARRIDRLERSARENLALQKETLAASLAIAGIDREALLEWSPAEAESYSFLDGLQGAEVREDVMLAVDHGVVPDFDLGSSTHVASKVFERPEDGVRLTVVMANRTRLEEQTGADLIYFNERFRAFVFVQYKAMEREPYGAVFRWRDQAEDHLVQEIARMDAVLEELEKLGDDGSKESFRLHGNPFFLKLCPRVVLNPDDKGLFAGMYIPLAYWKRFEKDACSTGKKGGRFASFENIGRKLSNSEFIPLVAGAWLGTTIPQSAFLETVIRRVLELNRTVTLAVEQRSPKRPDRDSDFVVRAQADPESINVFEELIAPNLDEEQEPPPLA